MQHFLKDCRSQGKRIGFTNGVFDILHAGHISLFDFARRQCDILIVGVNDDASVKLLGKAPNRPINNIQDRTMVLSAIKTIDAIVVFSEETPLRLIEEIKPDCLIKGSDYTIDTIVGAANVLSYGGEVLLSPFVEGKSSTHIINKVLL